MNPACQRAMNTQFKQTFWQRYPPQPTMSASTELPKKDGEQQSKNKDEKKEEVLVRPRYLARSSPASQP